MENKEKKIEDWEETYERYFSLNENGDLVLNFTDDTPVPKDDKQLLKGFIRQEIAKTEKRVKGEIVKKIKEKGLHLGYANDIIHLLE